MPECSYFVLSESSGFTRGALPRKARWGSGDDVGRDLVFDEGDAVAQQQLALLQPL
ncbi:hypothetical protein ABIE89_003138 [Bradyrhizobium niftali]